MNAELLTSLHPQLSQKNLFEALEQKNLPIKDLTDKLIGRFSEITLEDNVLQGKITALDQDFQDLLDTMDAQQMRPILGSNYTIRVSKENVDVVEIHNAALISYRITFSQKHDSDSTRP